MKFTDKVTKLFASMACMSLVMLQPASTLADYYQTSPQYDETECCASDSGVNWWALGAAALAGAGVGAAVGSSKSSGHHHRGGETFITTPFTADVGQFLTFTIPINVTLLLGTVIITPYVALPSGLVIEGTPTTVTLLGLNTFSVQVPNPEFGEYEAGLNIDLGATGSLFLSAAPFLLVSASRDGSVTQILTLAGALVAGNTQGQANGTFVYGPPPVP